MAESAKTATGAIDRAFALNIAAILVIVVVYGATLLLGAASIDARIMEDAEHTAERWFSIGIGAPDTVAALLDGAPLSPTQRHDLAIASHVGGLVGFQIYDGDGRLVRSPSGDIHLSPAGRHARNRLASRAIATGTVQTDIVRAPAVLPEPAHEDGVYINVFRPVALADGRSAVTMAQLDMSDPHAVAHADFQRFLFLASALATLALIFTVTSIVLLRRQRFYDRRIDQLANHDELTGIANRNRFVRRAPELIAASGRKGLQVALYLVDLDRFKAVNDSVGHADGDALIATVARRLVECSPGMLVARIGGDEFAVLQTLVAGEFVARRHAQAICEAVDPLTPGTNPSIAVTVSVGYTLRSADRDLATLMREAEVALHAAKDGGRNRGVMFKDGMGDTLRKSTVLRFQVQNAVRNRRLELYFQPLHHADGSLVSFEALVRLPDANGGHFPTEAFIAIAEEFGLIGEIGDYVLQEACAEAMRWPDDLRVAVNVSPQEFETVDILARVDRVLGRTGLPPERLEIEITENLFLADSETVDATLHALCTRGIALVMDDFGSGYSSLSHLWKYPFAKLKVDRSCFLSLGESESVPLVLRTIRAMAEALRLRTTAEGIESEGQRAFAVAAGYDELQGHLFSRPMPQSDVADYIAAAATAPALPLDDPAGNVTPFRPRLQPPDRASTG